ncbi:MAG: D-hexose-6-phosphate mutarotase [Magnetospirillum sp. WYHS-4]
MTAERLNAEFAIAGRLWVVDGKGGLPMIEIEACGSRASISIHAGQVLSFRPAGQDEDLLFLSDKAYYAAGKAIKGGAPVCWPWFGPDPEGKGRPGHGFVRNRPWTLRSTQTLADGRIRVRLGLCDTEETRALWPQAFDLELAATVGEALEIALVTRNKGAEPFSLSQGLHTYFRIGDIGSTEVLGLEGRGYIDKMDGGSEKLQRGPVTIVGETDRIYTGVAGDLAIRDTALGRTIRIASSGSASAVVWNPWIATAASMADLNDDDWKVMLCVETTNAGPDVIQVPAGGEHRLTATYSIAD